MPRRKRETEREREEKERGKREERRRETVDIGGRKCALGKGWVLEHCVTEIESQ